MCIRDRMGNVPVGTVRRNPKLSHTPTTQSCSDATCLSGTPLGSGSTAGAYAKSVLGFSYGCAGARERDQLMSQDQKLGTSDPELELNRTDFYVVISPFKKLGPPV